MNYIAQIRNFWRLHEEHSFTPTEIALYFHLLEVCNTCQWKNPFKRNNAKICADLGLSFYMLKNARNRLKQIGLLDFSTQKGTSNAVYTLQMVCEVTDEVTDELPFELQPAKDKQNKKKQNKTKVSNGTPPQRTFTPPTLEEVRAYCLERGNGVDPVRFTDFYASKGWMVGHNRMKDWRAAVRNWERDDDRKPPNGTAKHPATNYQQLNFYHHDERWNE